MIALTDTGLSCLLEAAKAIEPKIAGSSFRIGINVGDIIIDEGDIYGDGVNIAARVPRIAASQASRLRVDRWAVDEGSH
jgi:class 3 adenylate cyclase